MGKDIMYCKNCIEKTRADYWHRKATLFLTIIGGMVGGAIGWITLFSK